MRLRLHFVLLSVLAMLRLFSGSAGANELYALSGAESATGAGAGTYTWLLGYTQDLAPHVATSFSYLNEGHFDGHRRDGYAVQLWARTDLLADRLNLGAGIGPYLFFDTENAGPNALFRNKHGFRALASLAATWRTEGSLILLLRGNYVAGEQDPDTMSVLAGLGVQFRNEPRDNSVPLQRADNEITFFLGQTIVNSLQSQRSIAMEIEYRRTLIRHLDWTVALLDEGDNRLIRRDGIVTQLWATQELHHHRWMIGAGAGAYFDIRHRGAPYSTVSGIVGVTASYRMRPHWDLRLIWDRVVTDYDRDADVILAGLGYRF